MYRFGCYFFYSCLGDSDFLSEDEPLDSDDFLLDDRNDCYIAIGADFGNLRHLAAYLDRLDADFFVDTRKLDKSVFSFSFT